MATLALAMTVAEIAAWYAAIVSTTVLVWDVVKWARTGPRIKAEAYAGWNSYGIPATEGQDLTFVKLTNVGDRATTLTSWGMYWYAKRGPLRKRKRLRAFVVPGGLAGFGQVPIKLEPGDVWSGVMKETPDYNEAHNTKRIFMAFGFSHRSAEVLVRVQKPARAAANVGVGANAI